MHNSNHFRKIIYIATEDDQFNNESSNFVKIGRTRESLAGNTLEDRLKNINTGNPRNVSIQREIITEASDSLLESSVHMKLSPKRVNGEWFISSKNDLDNIEKEIIDINKILESEICDDISIENFSQVEDNKNIINPDSEAEDIHQELINLEQEIGHYKENKEKIELNLKLIQNNELINIDGICFYVKSKPIERFDKNSFKNSFPDIVEEIFSKNISSRFSIVNKPSRKKDEENILLNKKFKVILEGQKSFSNMPRNSKVEILHSNWLINHSLLQPLELRKQTLEKKLKVRTGENAGIKGICSWKRKIEKKFTKSDVEKYNFELSQKFIIPGKEKINFKINPFRPYKFVLN